MPFSCYLLSASFVHTFFSLSSVRAHCVAAQGVYPKTHQEAIPFDWLTLILAAL
jgi:hypothetical protein